jgi:predicted RNase H-like HicB family nuclease
MKNVDKWAEGYNAANQTIEAVKNIQSVLKIYIARMEREINELSPDDFESQSEYNDKFDWNDGYLARLEEEF